MAPTLVLRRDAENISKRFYAGKGPDAFARLGGIAMEAALSRKRIVSLRYIQLGKVRAAARIGCPF